MTTEAEFLGAQYAEVTGIRPASPPPILANGDIMDHRGHTVTSNAVLGPVGHLKRYQHLLFHPTIL